MEYLKNKTVCITGAAGSIGSELTRQVLNYQPLRVVALDQNETGIFNLANELSIIPVIATIRDKERIDEVFKKYQPDVVFHAAAYKHVPLMELNPSEARKTNIFGTQVLVDTSLKYKVDKFIFISTDKAVQPVSVMGKTKAMGERICQKAGGIVVRFGNVLTSQGSVIPIWRRQIEKGGPVTVTHKDMERYFMSIPEACRLVIEAGKLGKGGEIFILDMGEPIKILDIAKQLIEFSGKKIDIEFIGVRPGEKIKEEIVGPNEKKVTTEHPKIYEIKKV